MRLFAITLLAYLVCCASCFGEHGAYERVLFWYMYELDAALHGKPQLIAPRCTRGMPNRVKKCNLQQFLSFFDQSGNTSPITEDVSRKSLDGLAEIMQSHGYTGSYQANKVFDGLGRTTGNMGTVFAEVSKKMRDLKKAAKGSQDPSVENNLKNSLAAFETVNFIRQLNFSDGFSKYLREHGVDVVTKPKPWPGRETETREFLDEGRTMKKNPQHDIQTMFWEHKNEDQIHWPVVEALKAGRQILDCV
ncbi:hypothetical protein CNMCM7691_005631 [Aspergillus felis]|uniref:Uncharacterized protein n=1 Tax=Aspergillus felis TaxID=1287682 RepID=A0A8H6QT60_9EURO|nr:hypothetical protein CNMCM7691_005631 [Aspergillus felis]